MQPPYYRTHHGPAGHGLQGADGFGRGLAAGFGVHPRAWGHGLHLQRTAALPGPRED